MGDVVEDLVGHLANGKYLDRKGQDYIPRDEQRDQLETKGRKKSYGYGSYM
jgi:hypothetical protein